MGGLEDTQEASSAGLSDLEQEVRARGGSEGATEGARGKGPSRRVTGCPLGWIHSKRSWCGGKRMSAGRDCPLSSDEEESEEQKLQEGKGPNVC